MSMDPIHPGFMGFKNLVRVAKIPRFFPPQVIKTLHFVAVCTNILTVPQWEEVATVAGEPSASD